MAVEGDVTCVRAGSTVLVWPPGTTARLVSDDELELSHGGSTFTLVGSLGYTFAGSHADLPEARCAGDPFLVNLLDGPPEAGGGPITD